MGGKAGESGKWDGWRWDWNGGFGNGVEMEEGWALDLLWDGVGAGGVYGVSADMDVFCLL